MVVGSRSPEGRCTWQRYWANAVDVPGSTTGALGKVARQTKTYLVVGVIERDTQFVGGTLYCTMLYIGPTGELLGKHRKLKPTAAERLIWGNSADLAAVKSTTYQQMGVAVFGRFKLLDLLHGQVNFADERHPFLLTDRFLAIQPRLEGTAAPQQDIQPARQAVSGHHLPSCG